MERPLKERLVGAGVLVLVVVLVLPELLSGRREVVTLQPTHDEGGVPIRAHEFVLGDAPTAEEQAVAADTLQPDPLPDAMTSGTTDDALPSAATADNPPEEPVPAVAPSGLPATATVTAPPPRTAPVVVPATSSVVPPVKPAAAPLTAAAAAGKAPVASPPAAAPPTPSKATPAASSAVAKRSAPSTPPAAAPEPRTPQYLGAWVVQIGSFGTSQKAEQLVADLRKQGFRAFTLPYSANGRTLHRVRVGPEQNRKVADDIARRLADLGYSPQVAPQE